MRSRLYVPGTKVAWIEKAVASGVDAIILDLDDAVEAGDKERARGDVADALSGEWPVPIFVRINDVSTRWALDDLEAIVRPGLFGVVVPRLTTVAEISSLDFLFSALERRVGIGLGSIVLSPILETAASVHFAYDFARASARVDYLGGIATNGGDIEREIGYRWSRSAWESVAMRERCLVELRAAGVTNPLTGIWTSLDDPEGLRAFAEQGRDLGYAGMDVIHPSHVAVIHEVFDYDDEAIERAQRIVELASRSDAALDERQVGAIRFEGRMVDAAMVRTARDVLRRAGRQS
jgi:citrate lyase subunit beta/citryl-CoA lyase